MNKKGFTLIELLVVTTIMMIMTNIAYISFDEIRKITRDSQRKVELQLMAQGLESLKSDTGQYYHFSDYSYSADNFLKRLGEFGAIIKLSDSGNSCPDTDKGKALPNKYLSKVYKDPLNDTPYNYYYFADTYTLSDCYFSSGQEVNINNPNTNLLPGIDKIFPGLDGCPGQGECGSSIIKYNNLFKESCYGDNSNKVLYILAANLERKESSTLEIEDHFSFCPNSKTKDIEKTKDYQRMLEYFRDLGLDYFIIFEDIVNYWGQTENAKANSNNPNSGSVFNKKNNPSLPINKK